MIHFFFFCPPLAALILSRYEILPQRKRTQRRAKLNSSIENQAEIASEDMSPTPRKRMQ
jgi:hypothetical protein